jgi:uncharacterized protein (TIGR02996 family)
MSDWAAFIQTIVAQPDDDTPRLVFADWLDEHDDAARAEFIRLQCEIARMTGTEGARLSAAAAREKELWKAHSQSWSQELPQQWARTKVRFRRGFPAILSCTLTQWIGAKNLLQLAPIQSLTISPQVYDATKMAKFAATSYLAGVRAVQFDIYNHPDRADAIRLLSRSVCATGLRILDLSKISYTSASCDGDCVAETLATCGYAGLECLRLQCNEIGPEGVKALASSPSTVGLRKLDLGRNPIGLKGVRALAESSNFRNMTALRLAYTDVTNDAVEALASSSQFPRLTHLNLAGDSITAEGAATLARSPHFGRLTALVFHSNPIGPKGARALASSPTLASLTYLDLFRCNIGDDGLRAIIESPYLSGLRTLELGGNGITTAGLRTLAESKQLPALERLGLWGTRGIEDAVKELKRVPNRSRLHGYFNPNWSENAVEQEIAEHFETFHGETLAKRW